MGPTVTRRAALGMQVCVPEKWTDKEVVTFAEAENPCGTEHGWAIRRQEDPDLLGDDERVPCRELRGMVHIVLDA